MEPNTIQKHTNHCVKSMYVQFNGTTVVPAAIRSPNLSGTHLYQKTIL